MPPNWNRFNGFLRTGSINLCCMLHDCRRQKATPQTNYMSARRADSIRWMTKWNNRKETNYTVSVKASKHTRRDDGGGASHSLARLTSLAPPPLFLTASLWVMSQVNHHVVEQQHDPVSAFIVSSVNNMYNKQYKSSINYLQVVVKFRVQLASSCQTDWPARWELRRRVAVIMVSSGSCELSCLIIVCSLVNGTFSWPLLAGCSAITSVTTSSPCTPPSPRLILSSLSV